MARRTREISIFNLSFLDVLSNALGAVVALLLVSHQMGASARQAEGLLPKLEAEIAEARRTLELAVEEEQVLNELLQKLQGDQRASEELIRELLRAKAELETFKYRGLKTGKKEVVLLLDLSGSMFDERLVLKKGAEMLLRLLRSDKFVVHHFDVVTFRALDRPLVHRWPHGRLEATEENKKRAVEWLQRIPDGDFDGETPTAAAFAQVFETLKDGVVFLLTDGAPTDGFPPALAALPEDDPRRLDAVRDGILGRKPPGVDIRCLGIGANFYSQTSFRRFLEDLANVRDGSIGCIGL